jgi:hypothetical protein
MGPFSFNPRKNFPQENSNDCGVFASLRGAGLTDCDISWYSGGHFFAGACGFFLKKSLLYFIIGMVIDKRIAL